MSDLPGRSDYESGDRAGAEEEGWGSPVPAQYGSLRSVRPSARPDQPAPSAPEPVQDGNHDKWGVTSLLRRLQGDSRSPHPAGSSDGRGPGGRHSADGSPGRSPSAAGAAAAAAAASSGSAGAAGSAGSAAAGSAGSAGSAAAGSAGSAGSAAAAPPGASSAAAASGASAAPTSPLPRAVDRLTSGLAGRLVRWYDDDPGTTSDRAAANDSGFSEPGRPTPGIADTAAVPFVAAAGAAGPSAAGIPVADGTVAPGVSPDAPGSEATATAAGIDPAVLVPGLAGPDIALGGRRRRRRPGRMRTRATVKHLDIGTVIRVSLVFWLLMLVALVVASLLLWVFADAFGSLPSIEKSVRTLFSLKSFQLHPGTVALYTGAAGVVIAIAGMLGTLVFALIYNLIADVVGGVRVELESLSAE